MRIIFNNNTMRTGPSEDERYQYTNFSDLQKILDNNMTATPGEGPLGNVTPTLPRDVTAAPGEGPLGNVTPTLPGDVIAAPGQGPLGNVTPTVPSSGVTIIPIIPVVRYGYIKFFNSNSSGESIDIYINGTIAVSNLKFREYTEYFSGTAGNYRITVYSAGKRNRKLFERFFRIVVNRSYGEVSIDVFTQDLEDSIDRLKAEVEELKNRLEKKKESRIYNLMERVGEINSGRI